MRTTPDFTWRTHTPKKGKGKKLAALAFGGGLVFALYWQQRAPEQSNDLQESSGVTRASGSIGPTASVRMTTVATGIRPDPSEPVASVRPPPTPPVIINPSPKTTRPQSTPKRSEGSAFKRKQSYPIANPELRSESDYAALREFLLKR